MASLLPSPMLTRIALAFTLAGSAAWAQDSAFLFQMNCASCHRLGSPTNAPLPEALRRMSRRSILAALESGKMKSQGALLKPEERQAVADFLAAPSLSQANQPAAFCSSNPSRRGSAWTGLGGRPEWNGWGVDSQNSRFQPAAMAGLDRERVPRLKLKWAFGFPGLTTAFAQATIAGGRLFLGSADGTVYSLDAGN